jgi:hypothetical protein
LDRRFALFLAFIAVSVYANTLLNDFVAGDRQFILRNPFIGDPQAVLKSFTSDYWGTLGGQSFVYYRPLIVLTHFIDFSLYGLYPLGHHFSNLIFHTVVTLLVYKLFLCLIPANPWAAFAGGALFALHPVHTHSVAYVIGRTDILAAVFYVSGLILLIGGQQKKQRIAAACLCYFLALLCKEIAVTLPLVFLLYRFCWLSQHKQEGKSDLLVPFASLCATFMLYLPLRFFAVGLSAAQGVLPEWYTVWQRLSLIFIICGFYLWKLLLPLHLCFYSNLVVPGTWTEVVTSPFFLLGSFFFLSCCVAVKMVPRLGFALAWIGCSLIPVLNIIRLPVLAKENYLYIPSVGFCLLFAMLVAGREGKKKIVVAPLLFFIGLMYGVGTCRRNSDYRDPVTFLKRTLNAMPPIPTRPMEDVRFFEGAKNFYTTHRNLGRLYRERGQWEKAIASFEEALSYVPSYFDRQYAADIKVSLGSAYEKTGRLEEAFRVLSDVLPIADRPYYVNNLLGVILARMNDPGKAEMYFKQALKSKENYAPAHYNLGILYMKLNIQQKGEDELRRAAQLNPKYKKFLTHNAFPLSNGQNIDE